MYDFDNNDGQRFSRLKRILYFGIAFLLIAGLLWSGISGLIWLVGLSQNKMGVTEATATEIAESAQTISINRIVFINPDGQVETVTPSGADRRLLNDVNTQFLFPAWSPIGDSIAAIGDNGVYRFTDSLDSELEELYANSTQSPFYLYWSPDGRFLGFLTQHPQGIGFRLVEVDGEDESRLIMNGTPLYWDWMIDSSQILVHAGLTGPDARLAVLDVEDDTPGSNLAAPGLFQAPGISQNGRYWAYVELDENGNSWLVAEDRLSGLKQRQRHTGMVAFSWSPAADQLAFIGAGSGPLDFAGPLRLMDGVTGDTQLLSRENILAFFWSPDGRFIATIASEDMRDSVIAQGSKFRLTYKTARQIHPSITLNLIIIDVFSGETIKRLSFQPSQIFVTQYLPYFDQYALSHRLWSPDSQALVLPIRADDKRKIIIVPINDDTPIIIAEGDMPSWSHD